MATSKIISYFFLYDFYHAKGSSDDIDLLPESIIYFYPPKEDLKKQKTNECGELIGLIQCFKYDLFSCIPKSFNFKKSLVTCEYYGRHCAFLVLSKDRFSTDEANIHLTHILHLFNMLYGTLNHIQSNYPDINQIQIHLKQILTPILEYVFNENRSIQNLFSAVNYAPLKKNNQRSLLQLKHLLNYLQLTYKIQDGLFAYEKRILHSTFDTDTTFYLQIILGLEQNLPANEIHIPLRSGARLKNGVSLIRIYIRRPPSLQPILNAVNAKTSTHHSNQPTTSEAINIINPFLSDENNPSLSIFNSNSISYALSTSDRRHYGSPIQEDPAGSSTGEITGFETDISSLCKTETSSVASSGNEKKIIYNSSKDQKDSIITSKSPYGSLTDDQKGQFQSARSLPNSNDTEFKKNRDPDSSRLNDSPDTLIFEPVDKDYETDCNDEDIIYLPPVSLSNFHRTRRTITSFTELYDNEHGGNDHHDGHAKWGDIPDKNDEVECDEMLLYVQRNSRMTFAGLMDKNSLSEESIQKLWSFMLTEMADLDREIQVVRIAGETSKSNTDVKFQFNENSCKVKFERFLDSNRYFYKIPSAESACMAFSARTKLNQNPERKMIGFSRGNNLVSISRNLPDRVTYVCRRFQEPQ